MKVFQDFMSKLDSTEKHESNFGNLCMKKGGSFQKREVFISFKIFKGGVNPRNPPVRTPLERLTNGACSSYEKGNA